MLTAKAYAKVNLTLEALSRRDDGFHEIASVVQTIDLCDELSFSLSDGLFLRCSEPSLETPDNLVLRAAVLLKEHAGYSGGAEIHLDKSIPMAAGLGGGSSDASVTLKALNELWALGLSHDDLLPLAAALGSDVSFFLLGGTVMMEGRGEVVRPTSARASDSHGAAGPPGRGSRQRRPLCTAALSSPTTRTATASARLAAWIESGAPPEGKLLFNVFEAVAPQVFPSLEAHRRSLLEAGAGSVHLSGSGPTLYTLCNSAEEDRVPGGEAEGCRATSRYVACTVDGSSETSHSRGASF